MSDTNFTDGSTVLHASWCQDINNAVYRGILPPGSTFTAGSVPYTPPGTGAVATTVGTELSNWVWVTDYAANGVSGVKCDSTGAIDSSGGFQAAVNALPTNGGRIVVPAGTWKINTAPTWSTKNVYWDISPAAFFTGTATGIGAGNFPQMSTNNNQTATGPYLSSYTAGYPHNTSGGTGIGTGLHNVEVIQPPGVTNLDSVAQYLGLYGHSSDANTWGWGQNIVVSTDGSAAGTYFGIELDIATSSASATMNGILLAGQGTQKCNAAVEIIHSIGWKYGVLINSCDIGIAAVPTAGQLATMTGAFLGVTASLREAGVPLCVQQYVNGNDTILVLANTNTSPTGDALKVVNATNSTINFELDINGNIKQSGYIIVSNSAYVSGFVDITGTATSAAAGHLRLSSGTQTTIGANGAASALTANPLGYLTCYLGATKIIIPYYNG